MHWDIMLIQRHTIHSFVHILEMGVAVVVHVEDVEAVVDVEAVEDVGVVEGVVVVVVKFIEVFLVLLF